MPNEDEICEREQSDAEQKDKTDGNSALPYEVDENGDPIFRGPRIAGKVIKGILLAFVVLVNAIVLWRVFFSANIPSEIKPLTVNEQTYAAYKQHGESMLMQYQNQLSLTYSSETAGYFGVPQYVFIPEADQVQVVFRYNNSTLKHLAEDFGLSEIPDRNSELFDITLLQTTDNTPADDTDSDVTDIRILPSAVKKETTLLYTYYRLVFDGVHIDPNAKCGVFLDVYYLGACDYEQPAYGTLRLYDHLSAWFPYEITASDKKALAAYAEQHTNP